MSNNDEALLKKYWGRRRKLEHASIFCRYQAKAFYFENFLAFNSPNEKKESLKNHDLYSLSVEWVVFFSHSFHEDVASHRKMILCLLLLKVTLKRKQASFQPTSCLLRITYDCSQWPLVGEHSGLSVTSLVSMAYGFWFPRSPLPLFSSSYNPL